MVRVIPEIGRVAWYRLRLDLPRYWTSYAGLVVLVALVGGLSLGSIAGARRSESAFPTFLKGTNPSDLAIDVGTYNPKILKEIAHLPQVTSIKTYVSPNAAPVTKSGHVDTHNRLFNSNFDPIASLNGLYFDQDRMTILQGRLPDPRRPGEAMVNEFAASLYWWNVCSVVRFGFFSNAQLGQNGFPTSPATRIVDVRITGIGVANTEVVQDEIDKIPSMILTPALTRRLVPCCISYAWSGLTLRHGAADVPAVESSYLHLLPPGYPYYFHVTSVIENQAQQAVKPESIALAVFGLIAGLATLLIAIQLTARLVLLTTEEREVMWYLGARPWNTATDCLLGIAIALVLGAVGAAVVAVALSPLLIFGPLQSVIPASGFSVDSTVLVFGALSLLVALGAVAAALNYRSAPGARAARRSGRPLRSSRLTQAASRVDLPTPAVLGLRFALEGGRGRTSVPVRSSILASRPLAVAVVVGTLTFGNSLHTLIGTPRLYGWNWSAMLESDAGYGNVPQAQAARLLDADASVTGWTGVDFDSLLFDGQAVPVMAGGTRVSVAPALLSGLEVDAPDQVVMGGQTLAALHKRVGDTVRVSGGSRSAVLHIVGVATMPTAGIGFGLHLSIGSGAFVDQSLIPPSVPALLGLSDPGPNAILVRFAPSLSAAAAQRSLSAMVSSLNRLEGGAAGIISFTDVRPAEITGLPSHGGGSAHPWPVRWPRPAQWSP